MNYDQAKTMVLAWLVPMEGDWFYMTGPHSHLLRVMGAPYWEPGEERVRIRVDLRYLGEPDRPTAEGSWIYLCDLWQHEPILS